MTTPASRYCPFPISYPPAMSSRGTVSPVSASTFCCFHRFPGLSVNPIETHFFAERRRWIKSDGTINQRKSKMVLPIRARGHAILLGSRHRNYSDKFASSALGVYFAVIRNSIAFILSPNRSFIPTLTRAYRNGRPMQMYDPLEGLPKPSAQALS
jgi:hypothetical protein